MHNFIICHVQNQASGLQFDSPLQNRLDYAARTSTPHPSGGVVQGLAGPCKSWWFSSTSSAAWGGWEGLHALPNINSSFLWGGKWKEGPEAFWRVHRVNFNTFLFYFREMKWFCMSFQDGLIKETVKQQQEELEFSLTLAMCRVRWRILILSPTAFQGCSLCVWLSCA